MSAQQMRKSLQRGLVADVARSIKSEGRNHVHVAGDISFGRWTV
jgi:hypothetical protein